MLRHLNKQLYDQKFVFVSDTNWVHTGGYKVAPGATAAFTNGVGFQQPKRNWNPFALVQFRLNEEKYGISITGEVRSMLMRDAKPVVSLALSKKFDLSDLFASTSGLLQTARWRKFSNEQGIFLPAHSKQVCELQVSDVLARRGCNRNVILLINSYCRAKRIKIKANDL